MGGGGAECAANNTSAAPRGMLTNGEGRQTEEAGTAILYLHHAMRFFRFYTLHEDIIIISK